MGKTFSRIIIMITLLCVPMQAAKAIPVEDNGAYVHLISMLNEAKKQMEELQSIAGKALGIQQRIGDLTEGGMSVDAWINRGKFLGQCLTPELMNFKLPDGVKPQWVDLCQGIKSAQEMFMFNPEGEFHDGKRITGSEQVKLVNERRRKIHAETVVKSMAVAKQSIASSGELDTAAEKIIERSNAATDVVSVQRQTNNALASILREQKQQRLLLAQMLELQAATQANNIDAFPVRQEGN